jgi:hypothetical protein
MKKTLIVFLLFLSANAFALEAVVTVLETPLFRDKSYDAPVVQHLRKGDVIKIHPSVGNSRRFDHMGPRTNNPNTFYIEDEFIPTLDRQGKRAWVLSKHLYVYFEDARELEQNTARLDETDYRLQEPLPKTYPLTSPSGYRGQILFGMTQTHSESYPYRDSVSTKSYTTPMELNFTLLKQGPGQYQDRLFIGGTFSARTYENTYTFEQKRFSEERGIKFGVGPTISYDAFKGEKNRINISGTIIVNFYDTLRVTQESSTDNEVRNYKGYSLAPRLTAQYHRKEVIPEIDFVLGTSLEVNLATTYQAEDGARNEAWWQEIGADKFTTRTMFSLGGYVGIQSAY